MVAAAVSEQVEQHDPVALARQGFCDTAVDVGVEQQAVQVDEQVVALAEHLVGEVVALEPERPGFGAAGGRPCPSAASWRNDGLVGQLVEGLGRHASSLRGRDYRQPAALMARPPPQGGSGPGLEALPERRHGGLGPSAGTLPARQVPGEERTDEHLHHEIEVGVGPDQAELLCPPQELLAPLLARADDASTVQLEELGLARVRQQRAHHVDAHVLERGLELLQVSHEIAPWIVRRSGELVHRDHGGEGRRGQVGLVAVAPVDRGLGHARLRGNPFDRKQVVAAASQQPQGGGKDGVVGVLVARPSPGVRGIVGAHGYAVAGAAACTSGDWPTKSR